MLVIMGVDGMRKVRESGGSIEEKSIEEMISFLDELLRLFDVLGRSMKDAAGIADFLRECIEKVCFRRVLWIVYFADGC